jgi:hypothetical protein
LGVAQEQVVQAEIGGTAAAFMTSKKYPARAEPNAI